ncbi:hypothetical protein HHI36_010277 [Cryptolaemus montrouzieri]|uniref:Uncharacterized protein n=1 Tax=Cryptolaemus montrouzieri TaxID=559131 RepID=A0ABD2MI67_9CUCU
MVSSRTEKIFAKLMLEDEEADEVLIIPQQNACSDVESEFKADNEDEYVSFGLQSEFKAPKCANLQTLQNVKFEENRNDEENEDPNDQENDDKIDINSDEDEDADKNHP